MKNKLMLLPLLLAPLLIQGVTIKTGITVNSDTYGPYEKYASDKTIEFTVRSMESLTNINVYFLSGTNEEYLTSQIQNNIDFPSATKVTLSFTLQTSKFLNENGMSCKLSFKNQDFSVIKEFEFAFYPILRTTENINRYIKEAYQSQALGFQFIGSSILYTRDNYSFANYVDYFLEDYYYRLSLKQYSFSGTYLNYDSAYLHISDNDGAFPLLTKGKKTVDIPLTLTKSGNVIEISYAQTMYIDKQTLLISLEPQEGFVATSFLYLPINKKVAVQSCSFTLHIDGLGMNKTNFYYAIDYITDQNLIGDCHDSEYCIVGGVEI